MKLMHVLMTMVVCCTLAIAGCGGGGGGTGSGSGTGGSTGAGTTSWATLGVTSGSRQLSISWTKPVTKAATTTSTSTYAIYWSTSPGVTKQTGNKISNVTSPYLHTGLNNGTTYYYVVTETTGGVEGSESMEVAAIPQGVVPAVPTSITVSPANGSVQVKIDRTGVASTTKFNLYWSRSADLQGATKIANAFGPGTTFQHTALTNGSIYYYAVSAEGTDGESALSRIVAATPLADSPAVNYQATVSAAKVAAPNAVTAVGANQAVTLTWNLPTSQIPTVFDPSATPTVTPVISSFTVYWSTSVITDITKVNKITVPKGKLPASFVHNTGLRNGTPYYYLITAVADADANGNPLRTGGGTTLTFESPVSSQVMITPLAAAPAAPVGFALTAGTQQNALSWTKATDSSTVYTVYASTAAPSRPEDLVNAANQIATTSGNSYVHSGLQPGNRYYYTVTASTGAEGPPSAVIGASVPAN